MASTRPWASSSESPWKIRINSQITQSDSLDNRSDIYLVNLNIATDMPNSSLPSQCVEEDQSSWNNYSQGFYPSALREYDQLTCFTREIRDMLPKRDMLAGQIMLKKAKNAFNKFPRTETSRIERRIINRLPKAFFDFEIRGQYALAKLRWYIR